MTAAFTVDYFRAELVAAEARRASALRRLTVAVDGGADRTTVENLCNTLAEKRGVCKYLAGRLNSALAAERRRLTPDDCTPRSSVA